MDNKAVKLYKASCKAGNALGCSNLGLMYAKGQGVEADDLKALKYYKKACDGGDQDGCKNYAKFK